MKDWIGFAALAVGLTALVWSQRSIARRRAARERLRRLDTAGPDRDQLEPAEDFESSPLWRWLWRAGYQTDDAVLRFLVTSLISAAIAGAVVAGLFLVGTFTTLELWLLETPGGLGDAMVPIVWAAPWLIVVIGLFLPTLRVRRDRRSLVRSVESDLAITLELLASLAKAGLAFDAALDRILSNSDPDRPLFAGFERFRRDLRGGRSRAQALRGLAKRLDVSRVRTLVSALVQADRVGAGLATTLRQQADDLRQAQREHALALAQALPAKLVFPLVICFLPAIFVLTLGPVFFEFLQNSIATEATR